MLRDSKERTVFREKTECDIDIPAGASVRQVCGSGPQRDALQCIIHFQNNPSQF